MGYRASGPPGRRAAGSSRAVGCGPWRAVGRGPPGRGPAFSKTPRGPAESARSLRDLRNLIAISEVFHKILLQIAVFTKNQCAMCRSYVYNDSFKEMELQSVLCLK